MAELKVGAGGAVKDQDALRKSLARYGSSNARASVRQPKGSIASSGYCGALCLNYAVLVKIYTA